MKGSPGIMDQGKMGTILSYMHRRFNDTERGLASKLPRDYLERSFALNKLFCHKCMQEIKIGDRYEANKKSGSKVKCMRKYYHKACWDKMLY